MKERRVIYTALGGEYPQRGAKHENEEMNEVLSETKSLSVYTVVQRRYVAGIILAKRGSRKTQVAPKAPSLALYTKGKHPKSQPSSNTRRQPSPVPQKRKR